MVGNEALVAFAQRQHLGALQEARACARCTSLGSSLYPFISRPRQAAGERADPYPGILRSIWGGIRARCKTRPQVRLFACNDCRAMNDRRQDLNQTNRENFMSGGHGHVEGGKQEDRPAGCRPGGLPGRLGNRRQELPDRGSDRSTSKPRTCGRSSRPRRSARRSCGRGRGARSASTRTPPTMPAAVKAQIEHWRKTAQRYETEPETNEGRKELAARAKVHGGQARASARGLSHVRIRIGGVPARHRAGAARRRSPSVAWLAFVVRRPRPRRRGLRRALGFFAPTLVHL